jgi:hypothetical protein
MPFAVSWYSEAESILLVQYSGSLTISEAKASVYEILERTAEAGQRRVDGIWHISTRPLRLPSNLVHEMSALAEQVISRVSLMVYVENYILWEVSNIFVASFIDETARLPFAETVEEAYEVIQLHRQGKDISAYLPPPNPTLN